MGGYGALRLALEHPERFGAAASLSGALDLTKRLRELSRGESMLGRSESVGIFGAERKIAGASGDLFFLAEKVAGTEGAKPRLFLACGTEDGLLEENRRFHKHLDSLHYEHTYEETSGRHEWGYWDAQIQRVLAWLPLEK